MAESMSSQIYREIYLPVSYHSKWKEITLNTGASASTLQDIKVPESCGGYTYRDSGLDLSPMRNRFIYWKACNDVLELVEESLDLDLYASRVRFHFQDTAILGGVSIHEAQGHVIVLVPTVASVHRLVFPHPSKLQRTDLGYVPTDHPVPSVFYDASIAGSLDQRNTHMINPGGSITSHYHTAASYHTPEGEALFALASSSGSILLVKMPPLGMQGIIQQFELSQSSVMQKIWTGLVPSVIRGGQEPSGTTSSLVIHPLRGDPCILAVCRDHRLRVWSCKLACTNVLEEVLHYPRHWRCGVSMVKILSFYVMGKVLLSELSCTRTGLVICNKQSHECVLVCNLLDYTPDGSQLQSKAPAGTGHIIRKFISSDAAELKFGVHLNFIDRNQFCILKPEIVSGRLQIVHVASVFAPNEDLTDFTITANNIITLWTSSEGTSLVRTLTFGEEGPGSWSEVILQAPEIADLNIPLHRDPREVYLERLFQPGRFSMQDIRRALSLQVYSQSIDSSATMEASLNVNKLREDVTIAVETEIRNAAVDYEMQEEDYYQLQLEQWTKFYSCCIQYHEVGGKLKGLFADNITGLIGLIRKGCVTYLRPCDKIEELYCGSTTVDTEPLLGVAFGNQDNQLKRDLSVLWETLRAMSMEISEDLALQFEHDVSFNQNLDTIATQLIDNLLLNTELEEGLTQSSSLSRNLRLIHNLPDALNIVLRSLDLAGMGEEELDTENDMNAARQRSLSKLFTSKVGSDVLSTSVQQFAQTRFSALRDLYILQVAALRLGDQVGVTADIVRVLQNDLMPYTANLLRAYLVLKWSTYTLAVSAQANSVDINIRALSSLDISEPTVFSTQKSNTALLQKIDQCGVSLMDLFIQSSGGERARAALITSNDLAEDPQAVWTQGLHDLVKNLAKLVWPLCENFLFPEFLVGCCQYLPLQEYFSLLQPWCEFNAASRCFVQGLSYLHFDEPVKAAQCFNKARDGVANESFLRDRLLQADEPQIRKLEVLYYLKVLQQFEEFNAPDVVISLARTAIGNADDDDPNLPTLWSKVFKYQLELGHNTEAYNAMIENPDPSRRKDCLRQLLIMLCDRGDLQSLVDFPYTDLEEEVENILESRARSMDLLTHNYYDLLYAFHIFRNNYRKAGSVMYEHGMRLGREVPGKQGLQRQAQCYLSALNALRLVKPEYAWIIKPTPVPRAHFGAGEGYGQRSPKHSLLGDELDHKTKSKFEILELHDIEKEFMLVDARLRLISRDPDTAIAAGAAPGADEMVGLLVNAGMFDRAVIICRAFDLQLHSVFENLALRCVNLAKHSSYHMRGDNDYTSQAWQWLKTNNLTLTNIAKDNSSADQAWQLLQQYLDTYEESSAIYHRCTASKLLAHGFTLPSWFVNSYKGLNSAELLRLYIDYDLLEEATALCMEYIDAVIDTFKGQDCHVFQLKGCLHHKPLTAWLPYTSIDLLLKALHDHRQDMHFGQMYQALQDKLIIYTGKLRDISDQVGRSNQEQYFIT